MYKEVKSMKIIDADKDMGQLVFKKESNYYNIYLLVGLDLDIDYLEMQASIQAIPGTLEGALWCLDYYTFPLGELDYKGEIVGLNLEDIMASTRIEEIREQITVNLTKPDAIEKTYNLSYGSWVIPDFVSQEEINGYLVNCLLNNVIQDKLLTREEVIKKGKNWAKY